MSNEIQINLETPLESFDQDTIKQIIKAETTESEILEFKESINHSFDFNYKIRKTIAALANNQGGFILFGIKDVNDTDKPSQISKRLVGIGQQDAHQWLDEVCSEGLIVPNIIYTVKTINIEKKKVFVVRVSKSILGPCGVKRKYNSNLEFLVRASGSIQNMTYEHLRDKFDNSQLKWVRAGFQDLLTLYRQCFNERTTELGDSFNPVIFSSIISDNRHVYYDIFSHKPNIIFEIKNLHDICHAVNEVIKLNNENHVKGVTIENKDHINKTYQNFIEQLHQVLLKITKELQAEFPHETGEMWESFKEEFNLQDKNFEDSEQNTQELNMKKREQ